MKDQLREAAILMRKADDTRDKFGRLPPDNDELDRGALMRMFPEWPKGWNFASDIRGTILRYERISGHLVAKVTYSEFISGEC